MEEYFEDMTDPEAVFNKFMPMGINAMEQYTKFYNGLAQAAYSHSTEKNSKDDSE